MALTKIKIGDRFGKLTVIGFAGHERSNNGSSKLLVKCKCDCGNIIITRANNLTRGDTKSCGCYKLQVASEVHKGNKYGYKHGGVHERLYKVYIGMLQRCNNPNSQYYCRYGGRGIYVCKEWSGENWYVNFRNWAMANGYDPSAPFGECTINRIDNDGPYAPYNCEWVNHIAQMNNVSTNRIVEYNGESHTVAEWCRILNVSYALLKNRLHSGWPVDKALFTPSQNSTHYLSYDGNKFTMSEWCYILGLPTSTVGSRIERYGEDDIKKILMFNNGYKNQRPINAIFFMDENDKPISQQDYDK